DGRWVATCSWWSDGQSKSVRIWEADTGRHVFDLPVEGASHARFSPNGRWLTVHTYGRGGQLWEVGTWRAGNWFDCTESCSTPDSGLRAVNDGVGLIRFVDPETAREVLRLTGQDPSWYTPAGFTPDGTRLIAYGADLRSLHVWDLRMIRDQL